MDPPGSSTFPMQSHGIPVARRGLYIEPFELELCGRLFTETLEVLEVLECALAKDFVELFEEALGVALDLGA